MHPSIYILLLLLYDITIYTLYTQCATCNIIIRTRIIIIIIIIAIVICSVSRELMKCADDNVYIIKYTTWNGQLSRRHFKTPFPRACKRRLARHAVPKRSLVRSCLFLLQKDLSSRMALTLVGLLKVFSALVLIVSTSSNSLLLLVFYRRPGLRTLSNRWVSSFCVLIILLYVKRHDVPTTVYYDYACEWESGPKTTHFMR